MANFVEIADPVRELLIMGEDAKPPETAKHIIAIGFHSTTPNMSHSVTLASGPNRFVRSDSNINIAHVMEGNSVTKDVLFPGAITTQEGFYVKEVLEISEIDTCDACGTLDLPTPGFNWDASGTLGSLCLNCIRDVAMQYRANQSWNNKHGDPIANLRLDMNIMFEVQKQEFEKQKKELQDQIDNLKNN